MRIELSISDYSEIAPLAGLLQEWDISQVNVTHTPLSLDGPLTVEALRQVVPELDICLHVSLACLKPESVNLTSYVQTACLSGASSFLIVSGVPRPAFSSVDGLRTLKETVPNGRFYAAHNPFMFDSRLKQKQADGFFLQIGDDLGQLRTGIKEIQSLFPTLPLFGCLLIPTAPLLRKLSAKPWPGVALSQRYLDDLAYAEGITREILSLYQELGVTPLVERLPLTRVGLKNLQELLPLSW